MRPEAMMTTLKTLKLFGMAQAAGHRRPRPARLTGVAGGGPGARRLAQGRGRRAGGALHQLPDESGALPAYRDLAGFDFHESAVNEALARSLHRGDVIDDAQNVVLIGGTGTGETQLATAIGLHAIAHQHRRVRFFSTIELVNLLEQEKAVGKTGQWAHRLTYADVVVLDELGYLPFSQAGGALLFHLL